MLGRMLGSGEELVYILFECKLDRGGNIEVRKGTYEDEEDGGYQI